MASHVALLRAVNVGGSGKLAMSDLRAIVAAAGCLSVRTCIASGNVVFDSDAGECDLKRAIEAGLLAHTGRSAGVFIRTRTELAAVLAANPFADAPANRVMALFLGGSATAAMLAAARFVGADEELALGHREIFVRYGGGMGATKLRIPAADDATARNMNTVARLVELMNDPPARAD